MVHVFPELADVQTPRATPDGLVRDPLTPEGLSNLINGGETDELEFKGTLPTKADALAVAITASAFANTRGGRILIGVSDEASIIGCRVAGIKDTVTNIIRDNCDTPQPLHDISTGRPPLLVSSRPSANQLSCGSFCCEIPVKTVKRASDASKS